MYMKKLFLIAFLVMPFLAFSQTTLEEWNYITKGYKIQKESGLDMKKGYNFVFDKKQSEGKTEVQFYFLQKNVTKENVAIMVFCPYSNAYFCIPKLGNKDVNDLFQKQTTNLIKNSPVTTNIIMWQITNYINW